MLYEIKNIAQRDKYLKRKWFYDDKMDLLVWVNEKKEVYGFQLCYLNGLEKKALRWFIDKGYSHHRIYDNDDRIGGIKGTPLLVSDGIFDPHKLGETFKNLSQDLDNDLSKFIYEKIINYK